MLVSELYSADSAASPRPADHCRALHQETMMTPMKTPPVAVTSSDHSHCRA